MRVWLKSLIWSYFISAQVEAYVYHDHVLWSQLSGREIRVCFDNGNQLLKDEILMTANRWLKETDYRFIESEMDTCQVRVLLGAGDEYSEIGISSMRVISERASMRLMIKPDLETLNEYDQFSVLHEFGHVLGFNHEHLHPVLVSKLKNETILRKCMEVQRKTYESCQIDLALDVTKYRATISPHPDFDSVMMYNFTSIDPTLMMNQNNYILSKENLMVIKKMYPRKK